MTVRRTDLNPTGRVYLDGETLIARCDDHPRYEGRARWPRIVQLLEEMAEDGRHSERVSL